MERAETDRLKVNLDAMRKTHGFNLAPAAGGGLSGVSALASLALHGGRAPESGLSRHDLDAPQVLYKFTRTLERSIGEAESLSRALGDALDERRQFQARVWAIYERFVVHEAAAAQASAGATMLRIN